MQPLALALPTPSGGVVAVPAWLFLAAGCSLLVGVGVGLGLLIAQAHIQKLRAAIRTRDERIIKLQIKASKTDPAALKTATDWGAEEVAEDAKTVHLSWSKGKAAPDVSTPED